MQKKLVFAAELTLRAPESFSIDKEVFALQRGLTLLESEVPGLKAEFVDLDMLPLPKPSSVNPIMKVLRHRL